MIKITLIAACFGLAAPLPVSQEQLAQYVAAQQTAPRTRQAYALPPQYQQAEEPSEQPQYVPRQAYQSPPPSSSAYYQQSRQPQVQLEESQLQALRKLRPSPQAPSQPEEDYDHNPAYQFSFDVKDDEFTNYHNRKEQREGDKISGSYSIVDSDGYLRTVTYTADPLQGFKAEVSREPTDIKIKLPTPPTPVAQQYQQVPQRAQYSPQPQPQYQQPQPQYQERQPQYQQPQPQYQQPQPQYQQPQPQYQQPAREQVARKQQTQQYLEASSQLDLPQQYSLRPQPQAGLSAYTAPHRLASPKAHKAAAIGYATQPSTASPILYQAYQQ